ncbi:MAG: DUF1446 domain-containing protein [Rhodospirillaceae bacterium]|nr:DUF1446 domain-containing protein [Rhodospirillaceae bacterium]MBT3925370.1 DUF1446 domain-containing protein [Rhodospirillaceae bacterium]MBT4427627.1 DUF1446 domain-containing protein [Rhodospirillaceae bacterium]MBT5675348.1 DUF1446 domain-containing protein [Rhodospirillaceae bacterium]MBT5779634.1 DUF1446 domain-containing protein [Rhodospirillaceae bacterium]
MKAGHLRIGSGAGFAGDRWEPAAELVEHGDIDVIAFECLAERTIARETLALLRGSGPGYSPKLEERLRAVLPACAAKGIRIVTNMGAAAPVPAAHAACALAAELDVRDFSCAVLIGDDVRDQLSTRAELTLLESGEPLESILPRMASANAYLGADAVAEAMASGALAVITGRIADPSLFVGPMLHAFGWSYDDYAKLAQATAAGHLLECAGQVTGGYFADPGVKDVADLARLGFPFADITPTGEVTIGKLTDAGGRVDVATCSEQLLYEIDDPGAYITPDCVLDMGGISLRQSAPDRVQVSGARAAPRTSSYKVSVGYFDGYLGEGQLSYGGPNAVARARLAGEIVKQRLALRGFAFDDLRIDLIGLDSLHGPAEGRPEPYEVRLRVAGKTENRAAAEAVGWEVAALYTNGPSGGAGDFSSVREILAVQSVLLARDLVPTRIKLIETR